MDAYHDDELRALAERLSLEEKVLLLTGRDSWSTWPLTKIGLRSIVLSDGPAGVRGDTWDERSPSLNLPSPTAAAASWDRGIMRHYGEALGSEAVRKSVDVVLGPTINIQRTPYGGRHFEAFSEDPFLTAELASEYVKGVQSFGVGATVKHYVANDSETDRFTVDVRIDDRTLREVYLRAFETPIVEGRSWLVMSAYNAINGVTASENPLLETPLIAEWGFDGVVVSDWTAVRSVQSARMPQDLAMPGPRSAWSDALVTAVRNGEVDESAIDRKILRLLRLASRVGALAASPVRDRPAPLPDSHLLSIARDTAVAGTVLLKNAGILPLREPAGIAVIGEGAVIARTQGGGSATVMPAAVVTPLEGIETAFPDATVTWAQGAAVHRDLADLTPDMFTTPDGTPGMTVRYFSDGRLLAEEHRRASGIVSFDGAALAARSDLIEMQLTYMPADTTPRIPMSIAGLCAYEILVGDEVVAQGEVQLRPEDDPAAAVLHPPSTTFEVPVTDGRVELRARFAPRLGEMGDAMSFRIGVPATARPRDELIDEAVAIARSADVAVVVVSTSAEVESEGFDRSSLVLPGAQDDLVRAVVDANPRTVVVVNAGAPVGLPWVEDAAAVLAVWFPGQEFGHALGSILNGAEEPRGRLPMTWPAEESAIPVTTVAPDRGVLRYDEGVHVGYRAWLRAGADPAFPFGYGLGYTVWELDSLAIVDEVMTEGDVIADVTVHNSGSRAGSTVVQVYLERLSPSIVDYPQRWLAGFAALTGDAGEEVLARIAISRRELAHWADGWSIEPGDYRLSVGFSSFDIRASATLTCTREGAILARPEVGVRARTP
ncbi:beta-glucosidase [Microbacterium invictum]|uniref:Beta-glucosidase n=1 Tax=Microbacterium invictum TaxID=515415 RepID=A0AA40SRT1_9MICO|nr:glycoside hydrolase family 3 C-terminal domain-containing protein [Microbacterium invictum]MBB4141245.1 beta-glucosidase [Microbacterium invictum]